jgi:hypothetical protein
MLQTKRQLAGSLLMFAAFLAACSETSTSPVGGDRSSGMSLPVLVATPGVVDTGEFEICKHGTAATFEYSIDGGPATQISLADGGCAVLGTTPTLGTGNHTITTTELADPAIVLDSIVPTINTIFNPGGVRGAPITGTSTFSGTFNGDRGVLVEYYNSVPPPPGGGEGCTPGYWKQPQHFDSWVGFTQDQLFSSVFEDAFPGKTLLQVLSSNGNTAGEALGRHTVAALLNSTSVSYDLTTAQVIAAFNAVWPGTKDALNAQKNIFEGFNTQGCPLN